MKNFHKFQLSDALYIYCAHTHTHTHTQTLVTVSSSVSDHSVWHHPSVQSESYFHIPKSECLYLFYFFYLCIMHSLNGNYSIF